MANFTHVDYGSSDWNKAVNDNFDQTANILDDLYQDTDWTKIPLTNTVPTGLGDYLIVRKVSNRFTVIKAQFMVQNIEISGHPFARLDCRLMFAIAGRVIFEAWAGDD